MQGLQKSVWKKEIIKFLFAKNAFLQHAVSADEYVKEGKYVYIPQAGAPSNIEINRTSLPAAVTKRTDTYVFYQLDEYTSDPVLLTRSEAEWLSYDKMQSILEQDFANMSEKSAKMMLYNWAKDIDTAHKFKTTGSSTHTATAPGATGSRKNLIVKDLQLMQAAFDAEDIPEEDRYCLLESNCYGQLMDSMTEAQRYAFKDNIDVAKGVLGQLYGWNIMKRSKVLVADSSDVVKTIDAAAATSDNVANLFWQKGCVERAMGGTELLDEKGSPVYYGDISSLISFNGGRARRNDKKGVAVLLADA